MGGGGRGCVSDSGTWGPPDSGLCLWHPWHLLRYKYNPGGICATPTQTLAQRPGSFPPGETGEELGAPPELPLLSPPQGQRAGGSAQG